VIHADGTARIQAVTRTECPGFHRLISAFARRTGVPMLLNTSFNSQEPIVCTPADALRTFLRTDLDVLAIGDYLVERPGSQVAPAQP
jgi:carbamoyltransferase